MSEKTALKHGQAKVQYYACREKVYQLREAGYSIQAIYDLLTKDGIISMSYKALHRNISKDRTAGRPETIIKNNVPPANTRPAKAKSSDLAHAEGNNRPPNGQNIEWSLDRKLETLNLDAAQNGKRKNPLGADPEEFDSEEVL